MSPELLTAIVASASCVAFCLMVLMLVVVLFRKDPLCCRFSPYRAEHTDDPPHFHSRHSLTGIGQNEHSASTSQGATGPQLSGRLFVIGKPDDYYLNGVLPRLPSYESVRRKDQQRQIHSMISQRFSLSGGRNQPPPTYEETLRQSFDISPADLHSLDVYLSIHPQDHSSNLNEDTHNPGQPPDSAPGTASLLPST
ncbi:hypothetical protein PFLUV_G00248450 [Perca fluviatilis]|uniref:Uncharacterized protein n=1 Tax=Perca fluviatilis TaxID=8168 RepID=A0A6A5EJX3_PERFL|nr:hypothetical protein PFLUV_G00248450 [Perca fluviatilis]